METTISRENEYHTEKTILRSLFPLEVWLLIVERLICGRHRLDFLINSSLGFREWLLSRKTCLLFCLVWSHLLKNIDAPSGVSKQTRKVSHQTILKSREVCQAWCNHIDAFLSSPLKHIPNAVEKFKVTPPVRSTGWPGLLCPHGQIADWNRFNVTFAETHAKTFRSPFISRKIMLNMQTLDQQGHEMLEHFGKHVWYCTIYASFVTRDLLQINALKNVLVNLSNLKALTLVNNPNFDWRNQTQVQWLNAVQQMQFSTLPYLRSLNVKEVPTPVVNTLLDKHFMQLSHIAYCQISQPVPTPQPLPKVKFFKLTVHKDSELDFIKNSSHLETLVIKFVSPVWKYSSIFLQLKENLPNTVGSLHLYLPKLQVRQGCMTCRLNLKHVKKLKVQIQQWISVDFLLPMASSLETLCATVHTRENFDTWKLQPWASSMIRYEQIKFLNCFTNMVSSNIWKQFPRLKMLKVQIPTRKGIWTSVIKWHKKQLVCKSWQSETLVEDFSTPR